MKLFLFLVIGCIAGSGISALAAKQYADYLHTSERHCYPKCVEKTEKMMLGANLQRFKNTVDVAEKRQRKIEAEPHAPLPKIPRSEEVVIHQTIDQSAERVTYVHHTFGFSFQYPIGWHLSYLDPINAQFTTEDKNLSFAVLAGPSVAHGIEGVGEECERETITVADIAVQRVTYCGQRDLDTGNVIEESKEKRFTFVVFKNDDIHYSIEFYIGSDAVADEGKNLQETVLSSFAFESEER